MILTRRRPHPPQYHDHNLHPLPRHIGQLRRQSNNIPLCHEGGRNSQRPALLGEHSESTFNARDNIARAAPAPASFLNPRATRVDRSCCPYDWQPACFVSTDSLNPLKRLPQTPKGGSGTIRFLYCSMWGTKTPIAGHIVSTQGLATKRLSGTSRGAYLGTSSALVPLRGVVNT